MSSYGYNQCYAQCPPSTVTIQPPPFMLTIPGPELCCPNQTFGIEQCNPCAFSGGVGGGRYPALACSEFLESNSNIASLYSRPYSCYGYRRY